MKEVYLISGLGADKRVFDFLDLHEYKTNHVEWIDPLNNESITSYAKRLLSQITAKNPVIIGVSFGGVMAIEIGKLIPIEKIILISSVQRGKEIPRQHRWIGRLKLIHIIPTSYLNKVNDGMFWFFGAEKENEKELLKSIIEDTDPHFLRWGMDKILNWKNESIFDNVTTIHGSEDRLFPNTKADFIIDGGGHLMIINKSSEISMIIKQIIEEIDRKI